jgi:hypothetical protein
MAGALVLFFILINGVLALFIRTLPSKIFKETHSAYKMKPWEKQLYRRMGVRRWKNNLPQAGWMQGFSRKHLPNKIDIDYTKRFIWETCCAMFGHFIMALTGMLAPLLVILPWADNKKMWFVGLWCLAVFHFLIHILYVIVQRYNLPRFILLQERIKIIRSKDV